MNAQPVFHDPTYHDNYHWYFKAEGLKYSEVEQVYRHECVSGSFVFPDPRKGKINSTLNDQAVGTFGAHRCVWILREDIGVERFGLSKACDDALTEALDRPNPYLRRDDYEDEPPPSPYGEIV